MSKINPVELMKLLADDTRLTSVVAIRQGPRCVCDLMSLLTLSQPKVSRHLAILREAGLVTTERRGQWVYYSLANDLPEWITQIIETLSPAVEAAMAEHSSPILLTSGAQSDCC